MSSLTGIEKIRLEQDLGMGGGFVLAFTDRTFPEFMFEIAGVNIDDERYGSEPGKKAKRMKAFWDHEPDHLVAKVLGALVKDWNEYAHQGTPLPSQNMLQIIQRLKESAPVEDLHAIDANFGENEVALLAKEIRGSITNNEPQAGLDRLHTYLTKYLRHICKNLDVTTTRAKLCSCQ